MASLSFAKPVFLWLLGLLPILVFIHFYSLRYGRKIALKFANFEAIQRITGGENTSKNIILLFMRFIVVLFLILGASGTILNYEGKTSEYDLVLTIDASSSMLAEDYAPNRLEAAKAAAGLFIQDSDAVLHMGIVTFSGASFIQQTLAADKAEILNAIQKIEISRLGGTDLGQALITSANLMVQDSRAKAIILITDGQGNIGIPPEDSFEFLQKNKISVYTIGIGTPEGGTASELGVPFSLDEETLKNIASATGGKYYRPLSTDDLEKVFREIASIDTRPLTKDISLYLLVIALVGLFIEWGLIATKYRVI